MDTQTQSLALSKDPATEGFDLQAGETWIYPTNYSTRDYQFNIIQQALLKNTLVSLPTGLGKTFIAAVVMYNFYRWYPHGKIIFMAPTKPLVKQQVDACYNIMAIPHEVTAELTGTKISSSRPEIWRDKRVFFITPQVLQNDLEKLTELGPKIKCLVFDEAHKARGNHAYCQVIRKLFCNDHKHFRVLALSATPGCNVSDVTEVVQNLLISHLEFRTEESMDVQPYVFQRSLETVVVPLDSKLMEVKEQYVKILEQYTKILVNSNIIHGNCANLTKGKIFMVLKDFQNKNRGGNNSSNYYDIVRCLNICVTLYHAYDLLIRHGLRSFLSFYGEHIEKPLLRGNAQLRNLLESVRNYLGPIPPIEVLPDGTYPEIPKTIKFGHPKYYKLRDILISHFSGGDDKKNTRVIVFFEYRESVMEAHTLLLQSRPLLQPKIFLGQGSGVTQKIQLNVVKAFREGKCNTLLSTCIGEEGLDVGEVDLIVCFDISSKSPIRMVQRMGRTGRKRAGSVLVLVTEGREQQTLKDCLIHKNNISTFVLGSTQLRNGLYKHNPRLVPPALTPRCEKMFITVTEKAKTKKGPSILDKIKRSSSSSSSKIVFTQTNEALVECRDLIPEANMRCFSGNPMAKSKNFFFNTHIEKIRTAQKTCLIGHSEHTTLLNELLCFADSKRFNIPVKSQAEMHGCFSGKSLKQGDIRTMFFKGSVDDDAIIEVTTTQRTQGPEPNSQITSVEKSPSNHNEEIFRILSNYFMSDLARELSKCPCCSPDFCCDNFAMNSQRFDVAAFNSGQMLIPSDDIVDSIGLEDVEGFITSLERGKSVVLKKDEFKETIIQYNDEEKTFSFEAPANYFKILHNLKEADFITQKTPEDEFKPLTIKEKTFAFEAPANYFKILESLKEADFVTQKSQQGGDFKPLPMDEKGLLNFFRLETVGDIYEMPSLLDTSSTQNTIIYELDRDEDDVSKNDDKFETAFIIDDSPTQITVATNNNLAKNNNKFVDLDDFCDLSDFGLRSIDLSNIRKNVDYKRSSPKPSSILVSNQTNNNLVKNNNKVVGLDDFCDLSDFGLTSFDLSNVRKNVASPKTTSILAPNQAKLTCPTSVTVTQMVDLVNSDGPLLLQGKPHNNSCSRLPPISPITVSSSSKLIDCDTMGQNGLNSRASNYCQPSTSKTSRSNKKFRKLTSKSRSKYNEFLDIEAEVSHTENDTSTTEDEDNNALDAYEKSFVNDLTQKFNTDIHAVYLRSIRTPNRRQTVERRKPLVALEDVYSQPPPIEESEYLDDSFCVAGSDDEDLDQESELSELDILEKQLERRKKRKKAALASSESPKRRKRIKCFSSDDSA